MKLYRRFASITAGFLKDRCTLMAPILTPDGQGGNTTTYTAQETVWVGTRPEHGNRSIQEAQLIDNDYLRLYIRYGVTIKANYQIVFRGRTYTIHSITDVEEQFRYYEIVCYAKKL